MTGVDPFLAFVLRKITAIVILQLAYFCFDHGPLRIFHTARKIQENPLAISVLLGLYSLAIALA